MKIDQSYYFGCHKEVGHFLWQHGMNRARHFDYRNWVESKDSIFCPQDSNRQGVAALHHLFGNITVLAFWDNSVDIRGQSNSHFFLRGIHSFGEAVEKAKIIFPEVFARFEFEITEWKH